LCFGFRGIDDQTTAYLGEHLVRLATALRLKAKWKDCRPNVEALFSLDADRLAAQLLKDTPGLVGHGRTSREIFLKSRPIRWLSASETVGADGIPIPADARGPPVHNIWSASLITQPVRRDLASILIIVDASRLNHLHYGQLADYLGMIVFAHPDLGSTFSGDTVLAILPPDGSRPATPVGLTTLDRTMLKTLYSVPANLSADLQRGQIEAEMSRLNSDVAMQIPSALDDPDSNRSSPAK
jgi:hypothetical protein